MKDFTKTVLFETKIEYDTWVYFYDEQTKNVCWMKKLDFNKKYEKIGGK